MIGYLEDLRCARRALFRRPGLTLAAILTLALGIASNTVIFSVVEGVLIHPLPYRDADRLVYLQEAMLHGETEILLSPSRKLIRALREEADSFEQIEAFVRKDVRLDGRQDPVEVEAARVSAGLFSLLGIEPILGRVFAPAENREGAHRVALLGHGLWQSRFGADPEVLGQTLRINKEPYTILGVLPKRARYIEPTQEIRLWIPAVLEPETQESARMWTIARLRDGASAATAQAELDTITPTLAVGEGDTGLRATVQTVWDKVDQYSNPLLMLQIVVGFVLLIACTNVAHLLLAQGEGRSRELAVRKVLGAGRGRLLRQLLTENLALSLVGGAAGLLLTLWGIEALLARLPASLGHLENLELNGTVLAFTAGVTLLTGVLFGLLPALQGASPHVEESLKQNASSTGAPRRQVLRQGLVVLEVALAFMLLVGAGLLISAFLKTQSADLGFETRNLLVADVRLDRESFGSEPARQRSFAVDLLDSLRGHVASASDVTLASGVPPRIAGGQIGKPQPEGRPVDPDAPQELFHMVATAPGYFQILGIPLLEGRDFSDRDQDTTEQVLILNESSAKRFWPGESAVGRRLRFDDDQQGLLVVGVVGDVRHTGPSSSAEKAMLYLPLNQFPSSIPSVVIRHSEDPAALAAEIKTRIRSLDPGAMIELRPLEQRLSGTLAPARFNALVMSLFAGMALLLTLVGIYGVLAYTMSRRTWEIGLRMALGARGPEIARLATKQGLLPVAVGIALGAAGSLAEGQMLQAFVNQTVAWDFRVAVLVVTLVAGLALLAVWLPARRAARLEPTAALRYE